MDFLGFVSSERFTGGILVLSFISLIAGALMFLSRNSAGILPDSQSHAYVLERSLLMVAVVLTAAGFLLLDRLLISTPGASLAHVGISLYVLGAVLVLAGELLPLSNNLDGSSLIVSCVLLAFISQAVLGAAIVQSGVFNVGIGWFGVAWNLGMMALLLLTSRQDLYFPFMHHMLPLVLGIALLLKGK